MPEVQAEPAPAPKRSVRTVSKEGPPVEASTNEAQARLRDREADERFVAALAPALSPDARERAMALRCARATPRPGCWGEQRPFPGIITAHLFV